jgi:hypothetical protein
MTRETFGRSHRRAWRLLLLVLVIIPFLPEITIYVVTAIAKAVRCRLDDPDDLVCRLAGRQVSNIVDGALQMGLLVSLSFAIGLAAVWLALCYYTVNKGWSRTTSRLLLALLLTGIFAGLPYLAPNLALANVANPRCEAKGGSCHVFGGKVTSTAKDVVAVSDEPFIARILETPPGPIAIGAPIAAGMLLLYAVVTIVQIISRRRAASANAGQP